MIKSLQIDISNFEEKIKNLEDEKKRLLHQID